MGNLTPAEKQDIIRFLEAGKPLPDKYRFLLFEDKREVELVWNGKTGEVCNIVLPFQVIEQVDEPRAEKVKEQTTLFNMDERGRQLTGWTNSRAKLQERQTAKYTEKYADYLNLGVIEWRKAYTEHEKLDKKAILFVMTDDTKNCDDVAAYLEGTYPDLKGAVLVIHTKNNGEISEATSGKSKEELEELRKLANEIDSMENPFKAIVSVLVLKEGWDVRNVTTIVGLRAYSSKSNILPEQTLGRGLRKMYPGARQAGEGQQTKMEMIYQYLMGPQFRHRVQAIVEKFADMQEDLEKERKTMTKQWAKREVQIRTVIESTAGMYGDLQGIAGKSLTEIEGLEIKMIESADAQS